MEIKDNNKTNKSTSTKAFLKAAGWSALTVISLTASAEADMMIDLAIKVAPILFCGYRAFKNFDEAATLISQEKAAKKAQSKTPPPAP